MHAECKEHQIGKNNLILPMVHWECPLLNIISNRGISKNLFVSKNGSHFFAIFKPNYSHFSEAMSKKRMGIFCSVFWQKFISLHSMHWLWLKISSNYLLMKHAKGIACIAYISFATAMNPVIFEFIFFSAKNSNG